MFDGTAFLTLAGLCTVLACIASIYQVRRGSERWTGFDAPALSPPADNTERAADSAAPAELHGAIVPGAGPCRGGLAAMQAPAAMPAAAARTRTANPLPMLISTCILAMAPLVAPVPLTAHPARPQRYIIRLIFMVPVYAIGSYLSLLWRHGAIYFDTIRDWCGGVDAGGKGAAAARGGGGGEEARWQQARDAGLVLGARGRGGATHLPLAACACVCFPPPHAPAWLPPTLSPPAPPDAATRRGSSTTSAPCCWRMWGGRAP